MQLRYVIIPMTLISACSTGFLDTQRPALCTQGLVGQAVQAINSTGPVPEGCVKIEGDEIGTLPLSIALESITIQISAWTPKAGATNEYVGFAFTADGSVEYAIKAATRTFAGSTGTWLHPDGVSGPRANGISNITFCPGAPPEGDEDGGNPELPGEGGTGGDDAGNPELPGDGGTGGDDAGNPELPGDGGTGGDDAGNPELPGDGGTGGDDAGNPELPGDGGTGDNDGGNPELPGDGGTGDDDGGNSELPGVGGGEINLEVPSVSRAGEC